MRASFVLAVLLGAGVAGASFVGCGSSSSGNNETGHDSGISDSATTDTGHAPDSGSSEAGPGPDGGDGGCNFATFVLGLITNDTTGTAQPSTDLGQNCVDDQDAGEFKSLFP